MARSKEFEPEATLERAVDLFWERGYEKTSMEELVARMGIGRRSLYDTYGDKHALFLRALKRYASHQEAVEAQIAARTTDARQAIRLLLETALAEGMILRRGCMAVNTATEATAADSEVSAVVEQHFARSRQILHDLIERGRGDGTVTADGDAAALTAVVFNAWLGLRVRVRAGASLDLLSSDLAAIVRLLD